MITSQNAIIFTYIIWLIGKRDYGLDNMKLRGIISRWFFMAHTTGRYTSSPESAIESDLARLRSIEPGDGDGFCAVFDRLIQSNFTGDYWEISLPNRLDSSSASSPVLMAYWASLTLHDAELLFSDMRVRDLLDPALNSPRSIERHHLFPKAWLNQRGMNSTKVTNAIANMAFLDWPENAKISADDPADYWHAMSATVAPERLARQIYWHALPVGWEQLDYQTFLERRRPLIAQVIKDGFARLSDDGDTRQVSATLDDILEGGESQTVEFKSTARWNVYLNQPDKKMEHVIAKTVCGFLNSEGGSLYIGVDDEGTRLGLANDMMTLGSKSNRDGYELWLRQYLDNNLSVVTAGVVKISFDGSGESEVCIVGVAASGKAAFAKGRDGGGGPSEFWVRIGNKTEQLHGDSMIEYQTNHWG